MKQALKKILAGFSHVLARSGRRTVVLLYHAVGDGPWAVPAERFEAQLDWLAQHAKVCALPELLVSGSEVDGLRVAFTFDDGYASLVDTVAPRLEARGWSAAVYVNTGWIAADDRRPSEPDRGHYPGERFMSRADLAELLLKGWTIGSHGVDHVDMTSLDPGDLRRQLEDSRAALQEWLGLDVRHFAYPWGFEDRAVRRVVGSSGYRWGAGGIHGRLNRPFDALAFPRINVPSDADVAQFAGLVRGDFDFLGPWQRARRLVR